MRRYGWLLTILVVVAFIIIRHQSVPTASVPANAVTTSQGLQIPVEMKLPKGNGEFWVLARKSNHDYVVNLYTKQSLQHVFLAGKQIEQDNTGTTYAAHDAVQLDYTQYEATAIHVNPDGRSGYIQFTKAANQAGGSNQANLANQSGTGNQAGATNQSGVGG